MADVVVIGAGVAGLGSALALSRSGHRVTLVEQDATPLPADPAGAFDWDRRGAPQVRHSHALLGRLRSLLRDRHPDVLAALFDAGAAEIDFLAMMPEGMDPTPMDGDDELVALACRRTTFEWVLRRTVLADGTVAMVDGRTVTALAGLDPSPARQGLALVTGVVTTDAAGAVHELAADMVVAAPGRRTSVPDLLAPLGVIVDEQVEETGIIYFSRFFELADGSELPSHAGPIAGDLGYLKYGVFPGDNRTFSITMAAQVGDDELRRALLDPATFLRIAGSIPTTAAYVADGLGRPTTGVHVMSRLINRRRRFTTEDGEPLVGGFHAVGDAHTCTNPLYGRGCTLAMVQAQLLADATVEHGLDHRARGRAYEAASAAEILPWYRAAVAQDRMNREAAASTEEHPAAAFVRDGVLAAVRLDPVVFRAFLRMFNLLEAPDALMTDADVLARVMATFAARDDREPAPSAGPDRAELLRAVT